MAADRQYSGQSYTAKRHSLYGNTPDRGCKPTFDGSDIRFIGFGFTVTFNTAGTEMKSVLSKHGTSETRQHGRDASIISNGYGRSTEDGKDSKLITTRFTGKETRHHTPKRG